MTDGHLGNDPTRSDNVTALPVQARFRETPGEHPVMTLVASLEAPVGEARTLAGAAMLTAPGLRDVIAERLAQIEKHGFTLEHDLGHHPGDIAAGAGSYLSTAIGQLYGKAFDPKEIDPEWPWEREAWRPGDARANLIKAVAIALAVIDRIDAAPQEAGAIVTTETPHIPDGRHDCGFPKGVA